MITLHRLLFVPTPKAIRYIYILCIHLSDMWLSTLEIGAAQFRFVTEFAPKSPPFLFVYRSPIRSTVFGLQLLINFTGLALTFETGWCFVLSGNDKWNWMVFLLLFLVENSLIEVWNERGSGIMPHIPSPEVSAWSTCGLLALDMLFDHYFLHPSNNLQFIIGRKL